jgi:hypothetical protein
MVGPVLSPINMAISASLSALCRACVTASLFGAVFISLWPSSLAGQPVYPAACLSHHPQNPAFNFRNLPLLWFKRRVEESRQ